jgi:integrase
LARYTGLSRRYIAGDLWTFLDWCTQTGLDPLTARRVDIELYLPELRETRALKPSTISRRLSVLAGFYRTRVIDAVLDHSPAVHVRRPPVPPESPTLGLSHLQFEALLSAAARRLDRGRGRRAGHCGGIFTQLQRLRESYRYTVFCRATRDVRLRRGPPDQCLTGLRTQGRRVCQVPAGVPAGAEVRDSEQHRLAVLPADTISVSTTVPPRSCARVRPPCHRPAVTPTSS